MKNFNGVIKDNMGLLIENNTEDYNKGDCQAISFEEMLMLWK